MESIYRLAASEIDDSWVRKIKTTYQGKKVEIIVSDIDDVEDLIRPNTNSQENPQEQDLISLSQRRSFLKLPLSERRRLLAQQAEEMAAHYQQDSDWQEWSAGNVVDY